ncbi:MAG: hypothetical protein U5L45_09010 [Saprospiraceae bacterium]|nr:hypothetical protein [Saprospiraceae bacterium]
MVHFSGFARKMNHFFFLLRAKRAIKNNIIEVLFPIQGNNKKAR